MHKEEDGGYIFWGSSEEFYTARMSLEKCIYSFCGYKSWEHSSEKEQMWAKITNIINAKRETIESAISQRKSKSFEIMVQAISGGNEENGREYFNRDFLNYMLNLQIQHDGPYLFDEPKKHSTGIMPKLMSDFGRETVVNTYIGDVTCANNEIFDIYEDIRNKTSVAIDDLAQVLKREYYTKMSVEAVKDLIQSKISAKIEDVAKTRICTQKRYRRIKVGRYL